MDFLSVRHTPTDVATNPSEEDDTMRNAGMQENVSTGRLRHGVRWQPRNLSGDTAFEATPTSEPGASFDSKAVSQPPHSKTLRRFGPPPSVVASLSCGDHINKVAKINSLPFSFLIVFIRAICGLNLLFIDPINVLPNLSMDALSAGTFILRHIDKPLSSAWPTKSDEICPKKQLALAYNRAAAAFPGSDFRHQTLRSVRLLDRNLHLLSLQPSLWFCSCPETIQKVQASPLGNNRLLYSRHVFDLLHEFFGLFLARRTGATLNAGANSTEFVSGRTGKKSRGG